MNAIGEGNCSVGKSVVLTRMKGEVGEGGGGMIGLRKSFVHNLWDSMLVGWMTSPGSAVSLGLLELTDLGLGNSTDSGRHLILYHSNSRTEPADRSTLLVCASIKGILRRERSNVAFNIRPSSPQSPSEPLTAPRALLHQIRKTT